VLLDHGIYTEMNPEIRISYNQLWRGILSQDEDLIRTSSASLGVDLYDLFAGMVADRKYEDIMDKDNTSLKSRMKVDYSDASKRERYEFVHKHHDRINNCLKNMAPELLIVFKTNDYLRAIDKRLGNPTNTFNTINEATWRVYRKEVCKRMTTYNWMKEIGRYYMLKFGLFMSYFYVRFRVAFGLKVDIDELEDFELDCKMNE
jgi:predicted unusual protein kinase regulating ubiquinone biosynthesis (AarF/ABC1/UbiB family)